MATNDAVAALRVVALCSGCRAGELLNLTWQDMSLEAGTISIRRTLIGATGGAPRFGETKTARSRRTVTLSGKAVTAPRLHRQRQQAQREALGVAYSPAQLCLAE